MARKIHKRTNMNALEKVPMSVRPQELCFVVALTACFSGEGKHVLRHAWGSEDNLQEVVFPSTCGSWGGNTGHGAWQQGHLLSHLISPPFFKALFLLCGAGGDVYKHHVAHVMSKDTWRESVLSCYIESQG